MRENLDMISIGIWCISFQLFFSRCICTLFAFTVYIIIVTVI